MEQRETWRAETKVSAHFLFREPKAEATLIGTALTEEDIVKASVEAMNTCSQFLIFVHPKNTEN